MRIANIRGRLNLVEGSVAVDVETASEGTFNADPAAIYPRWAEFTAWAGAYAVTNDSAATTFLCNVWLMKPRELLSTREDVHVSSRLTAMRN